jgi:hypothetical protein
MLQLTWVGGAGGAVVMVANIAATLAMGRSKFSPLGVLVPSGKKEAYAGTPPTPYSPPAPSCCHPPCACTGRARGGQPSRSALVSAISSLALQQAQRHVTLPPTAVSPQALNEPQGHLLNPLPCESTHSVGCVCTKTAENRAKVCPRAFTCFHFASRNDVERSLGRNHHRIAFWRSTHAPPASSR